MTISLISYEKKLKQLDFLLMTMLALFFLIPLCANSYRESFYQVKNSKVILSNKPGYLLVQEANKLTKKYGSRLMNVGFENAVYFFNGTFIGDWFGIARYSNMLDCKHKCALIPPQEMKKLMEKFNCKMLVLNTKRFVINLNDYQRLFNIESGSDDGILLSLNNNNFSQ